MLDDAYASARKSTGDGIIRSLIVPHAGYVYSLKTAMHAFKSINPDDYDRVVLIGPLHPNRGVYPVHWRWGSIPDATRAETPLGNIKIDTETVDKLTTSHRKLFKKLDARLASVEHSLEMEFPILKFIFKRKDFTIVPILTGILDNNLVSSIAGALRELAMDERTLFVISSDFCHWGNWYGYKYLPDSDGEIYERIEALDREAMDKIASGNVMEFSAFMEDTRATICGSYGIQIMMNLFESYRADFPAYAQSSRVTTFDESSVSYVAGVIRTDARDSELTDL